MKNPNIFYVYEHWRADKDVCFYVGKGKGWRANKLKSRNPHHLNIQKKLARLGMCVEVRMVGDCLTEREAFDLEISRIAMWREGGSKLANRTSGGEGLSNPPAYVREKIGVKHRGKKHALGFKRSSDQCAAISKRMMGNKIWLGRVLTEEHKKNLSIAQIGKHFRKHTPEAIAKISEAARGRVKTPEQIAKLSASIKKSWETRCRTVSPETLAKRSASTKGRKMNPQQLEAHRAKVKKSWETRSRKSSEEARKKISDGLKRAYAEGRR